MHKTIEHLFRLSLLAFVAVSFPAAAQEFISLETVANRVRPGLDPLGIRLGNFVLSPSLGVESHYNDNIFADPQVSIEDFIYLVNPGLSLESDWNNHDLNIEADASIGRYADNEKEDFEDFSFLAHGRLDISRGSYISGELSYGKTHEERTSAENTVGADLTVYEVNEASVTFLRRPNRFFLRLDAAFRDTDFEDTRAGNRIINNDDRNRRGVKQSVHVGYEFTPGSMMYLRGTANSLDYEQRRDDDGFQRSWDGYEVVLGASRPISGVSSVNVFTGYLTQDIEDPRFESVDGVSFGADITWDITNLITMNVEARRTIEPTSIFGASSVDATRYSLKLDYELLRSLIFSAEVEVARDDYQGLAREDEILSSGVGAKFMLNRTLHVFLGYDYAEREVSPLEFSDDAYEINAAFIRIQGQL